MQMTDPYTIHAASEQEARRRWDETARCLGRQLTTTPQHLSRVLYIPRHDSKTSHLPLYDVSSRYAEAVGDTPMGSSKYTVALGMIPRPEGDGTDGVAVSYLVDFKSLTEDALVGEVQYRGRSSQMGGGDPDVQIHGSSNDITINDKHGNPPLSLGTSYPIPATKLQISTIYHPYFHYDLSSGSELAQLLWETHP
ncbi:hypothetical protein BJX70DRAFT_84286 [Aspergillus crustosus]